MASFSDLPNELVREIAGHVTSENIESFSLISKSICAMALPLLKEHRELSKRFNAFGNLEMDASDGCRLEKSEYWDDIITSNCTAGDSLSNLLIDVLTNRRVAPYIKEFRQEDWAVGWQSMVPDPSNERHEHKSYTEEQFILFRQALSNYVLPTNLQKWIEELESGHEGPIMSLLLVLLPNINSIKLEGSPEQSHQIREVMERIDTDCIPDISIHSRLERVNLQFNDYFDRTDRGPVEFLAFLAAIPSLKSLYSQYVIAANGDHDFSCLLPKSSNITDLGCKRCNLSLGELEDLIQGLKALQDFRYIYDEYDGDLAVAPWDPAGMCKVLSEYAKGSIEVLDLRSDLEPVGPIESFLDFGLLKELSLSFSLFRKKGIFPSRTLASELPRSLQKISLHDIKVKHISLLESTIREVVLFKPDCLSKLEEVCFWASWDLYVYSQITDKLRRSCEDAGFELCLIIKSE